jgi:hypothetical protein
MTFSAFKNAHENETVVVCGCGPSLHELTEPSRCVTIGVNDVGRLFDPTYLVVLNPRSQFSGDRFKYVEQSRAKALFTQLADGINAAAPIVRFRLGKYRGTDLSDPAALPYTKNSPYVAVCLAMHMGARRIGLLGVDFTDHHFFGPTGVHPLTRQLATIDEEYRRLRQAASALGVEIVNLSSASRLQSLPRVRVADFILGVRLKPDPTSDPPKLEPPPARASARSDQRRLFVVNYRFLSCGDVFADGLRNAARDLGLPFEQAWWDDPLLPAKVDRFRPDLLLVVHGRRFAARWRDRFKSVNSAVWLVDEPYEVDDTSRWSGRFDTVFVNDPATLSRHRNAHYLPVCFDPAVHRSDASARPHQVGFIGGANATRERFLMALAEQGLLGYVVGGPWQAAALRRRCLSTNVPAERTALLYQQTEIVLNVFREKHHFNAQRIAAGSLNPRIYEALACGAAVVTERRDEVADVFPQMPQFETPQELVATVRELLADRQRLEQLRVDCRSRLRGHSYRDRLEQVLATTVRPVESAGCPRASCGPTSVETAMEHTQPAPVPQRIETRPAGPAPFAATPRRNLIYHVWPVRGSTWRWNLDELVRRIDLFNGRRVIGIVCDERSEDAAAVQSHLEGHGCEFVVMRNDARGESATFAAMLERVASGADDEVSFYAHAKGVKYEPKLPRSVKRWAEVQYAVTLDDWLAVREQLDRFAMTGIFRKHGRFANHQNLGDWHYSGTFFWMRHASVFARDWRNVPQFYGGVEAWPGMQFAPHETGCLLLDNLRELPYQDRFWAQKGNAAAAQWKAARRTVPVPPDLARPLPLDGLVSPRLEQKPDEFAFWLERLLESGASSLLTIGGRFGGAEWHVARVFRQHGRSISITALDAHSSTERQAAIIDARARFAQAVDEVVGDVSQPEARAQLATRYDAVYIDGDHGYRACRRDLLFARSLDPLLIGLHDIVDSDWHAASWCCVSRVWDEAKREVASEEMQSGTWGGVGLLHPRRPRM